MTQVACPLCGRAMIPDPIVDPCPCGKDPKCRWCAGSGRAETLSCGHPPCGGYDPRAGTGVHAVLEPHEQTRDTNLLGSADAFRGQPRRMRPRGLWDHLTREEMLKIADDLSSICAMPPRPALDAILPESRRMQVHEAVLWIPPDALLEGLTAILDGKEIVPLVVFDGPIPTRACLRRENGETFPQGARVELRGKCRNGQPFYSNAEIP